MNKDRNQRALHTYNGNTGCQVFKWGVQNQHAQRKLLNFENWCNGKVSKSALI